MQNKNKKNNNTGFTIIETMIAVSLFLTIIMVGMDSLLNVSMLNGKSQNTRAVVDNLSFIMEDMSRNLRNGSGYNSSNLGQLISFTSFDGNSWIYKIEPDKISKSKDGGSSWVELNPVGEIKFDAESSGFLVSGVTSGDTLQPIVTIKLVGEIQDKNIITPFLLQTSISQRLLDKP